MIKSKMGNRGGRDIKSQIVVAVVEYYTKGEKNDRQGRICKKKRSVRLDTGKLRSVQKGRGMTKRKSGTDKMKINRNTMGRLWEKNGWSVEHTFIRVGQRGEKSQESRNERPASSPRQKQHEPNRLKSQAKKLGSDQGPESNPFTWSWAGGTAHRTEKGLRKSLPAKGGSKESRRMPHGDGGRYPRTARIKQK